MTPAHVHISFAELSRAGRLPTITVGAPTTQGLTVFGMQGIGVSTPAAAAVAAAQDDDHTMRSILLNITGPEKLSIRALAEEFGRRLDRTPVLTGTEAPTAWLADASESLRLFGPPETTVARMMDLISTHVRAEGRLLEWTRSSYRGDLYDYVAEMRLAAPRTNTS